ncbi:hypothetical protein AVEN_181966-1 [Araneus ventricosus]|uniref:Fork-head domain-containing protein n=1 Tax=Araneus ventricosus TaxID=182803 RepID=A0A4Y2JUG2_ARAVE|nr:hypothetical protein AVEN_181966-1 [Araneus ventricosus]
MERRRKPTVIKLREHLQDTTIRHAGGAKVDSSLHLSQPFENCATTESLAMISQLDEELQNDFKWLIGFDLRTVFLHDIEEDNSTFDGNRKLNGLASCKEKIHLWGEESSFKKKGRRTLKQETAQSFKSKKYSQSGTFTAMIFRCLHENGEASVKNIYNWISDTFPDFNPSDISWKNAVRHTLTVSPIFQKKKSPCGKCHLWYLNRTSSNITAKTILQPFSAENFMNTELQNSRKLKPEKQNRIEKKSSGLNEANKNHTHGFFTPAANKYDGNNYQQKKYNAENWVVTNSEIHDYRNCSQEIDPMHASRTMSEQFYIQEIPITEFSIESTNYTEPMEVKYLLDENAASIPVQIIQGKSF